nr:MAG TPA: hypothetical protein [Caudoviricetes sp.]DAU00444.1 MAG TPA: hypothetical protein [Caudoviricetes sp.]
MLLFRDSRTNPPFIIILHIYYIFKFIFVKYIHNV